MTTDGWGGVRAWIGRWLGRGRTEVEAHQLSRLDQDHQLLLASSADEADEQAGRLACAWTVRLQDAADMDADAARELLEFVARWRAQNPDSSERAAVVRQKARASGHSRIVQVGGNQTVIRSERS
ncbi:MULTISPECIES: hypothetical protein [unclassified Streptomyces]|uniref:hypothetical protein n=1 Tax=unclassified Streptomyces TaxID=2593676 RepID=UPI00342336B4